MGMDTQVNRRPTRTATRTVARSAALLGHHLLSDGTSPTLLGMRLHRVHLHEDPKGQLDKLGRNMPMLLLPAGQAPPRILLHSRISRLRLLLQQATLPQLGSWSLRFKMFS